MQSRSIVWPGWDSESAPRPSGPRGSSWRATLGVLGIIVAVLLGASVAYAARARSIPAPASRYVVVVERAGDWARVIAVNGWTGWVDADRLVARG